MLNLKQGRKVAVMEGDTAVAKAEIILRITCVYTDYLRREVRVVMHRGFINPDNSFTITNNEPVMANITDEPERQKLYEAANIDGVKSIKSVTVPARPLFTLLATPQQGHATRWAGDFRLKDIENIIKEYNLIPEELEGILEQ